MLGRDPDWTAAVETLVLMADSDDRRGDHASALRLLDSARAVRGDPEPRDRERSPTPDLLGHLTGGQAG